MSVPSPAPVISAQTLSGSRHRHFKKNEISTVFSDIPYKQVNKISQSTKSNGTVFIENNAGLSF